MKILIMIGAKKNGNTDKLAKRFAEGALSAGHAVNTEYLFDKDIHGCIDCQTCQKNGGVCVWQDDVPEILDKLIASDIVVFASPVYFFSISAQLKMFMDRAYAKMIQISDKKCYLLTTAAGPSSDYANNFQRVAEPILGWLNCFENMEFVKTISEYDTGSVEISDSKACTEAFLAGKEIAVR